MKKILTAFCAVAAMTAAADNVASELRTPWAETVTPDNVWQQYPRPNMVRPDWENLNGTWEYAILPKGAPAPAKYQGDILVPFAIESALSGVGKTVGDKNELWYRRSFTVPKSWAGKDVLLNFGAVDWQTDVWVNGARVGSHTGGFAPFSINITDALNTKGANELVVRVFDPTDAGPQPRGKQVAKPKGIWYTPVTGIWQTVWLEPVSPSHISRVKTTPDVDSNTLAVEVDVDGADRYLATVRVLDGGKEVAAGSAVAGQPIEIAMPADVVLWSPENPKLYDVEVALSVAGRPVDKVKSYTAMRKVSTGRDADGVMRLQLNNNNTFMFGPLDQGWWPDGLYTAPSYEAMKFDIDKTKELGFNMIRKHIKVEPALWYAYCDSVGILVWQDMPSGDKTYKWNTQEYYTGPELERTAESDRLYRTEWKEIMDHLHNYPSIVTWIPFNEAWGQYNTVDIAEWTKQYDPSRLVNPASGGNFFAVGDILDIHNYPEPAIRLVDPSRATVLGEYGGIGYAAEGHLWKPDRNWGYVRYNSPEEVTEEYINFVNMLIDQARKVYSAAVYTQTTDVENEVNGFLTYDRKVMKMDVDSVRAANRRLIETIK